MRGYDPTQLNSRPYQLLGVAWPILPMLGSAPIPLDVAAQYWAGVIQLARSQVSGEVLGAMQRDAEFFFRRGFMSLLEGDIPAAKERFRQSTRPPPGWNIPTVRHPVAVEYLRLIEAAERKQR